MTHANGTAQTHAGSARRHGGLPSYFCGNLRSAMAGGTGSYAVAGWHLGLHRTNEYSYELEPEGEDAAENELATLMDGADEKDAVDEAMVDGGVAWLGKWLPDFVEAVPPRRRRTFARGFLEAVAERG